MIIAAPFMSGFILYLFEPMGTGIGVNPGRVIYSGEDSIER